MGLFDEIKKLTHPYSEPEDDYDDYDDEDDGYEDEAPAAVPERPAPRRSYSRPAPAAEPAPRSAGRVLTLNNNAQLQVVLVKPERFEQVSDIADHLLDQKAVVMNIEAAEDEKTKRRLVDFLSGSAYALNGKINRISKNIFLVTPCNVNVASEMIEDIKNSETEYI